MSPKTPLFSFVISLMFQDSRFKRLIVMYTANVNMVTGNDILTLRVALTPLTPLKFIHPKKKTKRAFTIASMKLHTAYHSFTDRLTLVLTPWPKVFSYCHNSCFSVVISTHQYHQ